VGSGVNEVEDDFVDMLDALGHEGCDFLVVGGHALAAHGAPRATGDIDILVRADAENARRVVAALRRFGAPLAAHGVDESDFSKPGIVYQLGLPPRRIDILTELSGVSFDEAAKDTVRAQFGPCAVSFIGLEAMIKNKRASGRPKDLVDVATLEALRPR
jgi:hypothetical protein